MHRSGATPRQNDDKLSSLSTQIRARLGNLNLKKSTPSVPLPRLSEVALRGMHLQQQPFSPPVGAQSYYVDNMTDGLLEVIEESLLQSDNLLVLAGEPNSGKTCSAAQLVHALYDQCQLFLARGGSTQSAEQIIRSMLGAYRSTTPTHVDDCLEHLCNYLADSEDTSATNILILEDADLLDRREMQLLLNHLDHVNESLNGALKILFTSALPAKQLLHGIHSDQIGQSRVEEFRQPLLDEEHVIDYIDARLLMAGSDQELPLSERALRLITQTTNGLPGEIDRATTDALNSYFQNRQFKALLSPAHWRAATRKYAKWLVLGGTLLLTGLAMAFFSGVANPDLAGTTVKEIPIPSANQPAELQLVPPPVEPTPAETVVAAVEPVLVEPVEQTIQPTTPEVVAAIPVAPEPVVQVEPAPVPTPVVEAEPAPEPVVAETVAEEPTVVANTAAEPTPTATATTSGDFVSGVISGHQWILRRDPARFTAQLSAGWSERDLRLFATRNGMTNKTAIYRTERDGKGWFSLVHGDFSGPSEARVAIAALPAVWRKNAPWIRSFASVQKSIQ